MKTKNTQIIKKMYSFALTITVVCTIALFSSCAKEDEISATTVYIAGNTQDGVNAIPCYWKDNTLNTLSTDLSNGSAKAIQVVGNTVYTAGYRFFPNAEDSLDTFFAPCYWKNGASVDLNVLEPSGIGKAEDIQVVGNYIFIAGFTTNDDGNTEPCYWIDNKLEKTRRVDLPLLDNLSGEAKALHIKGNNIYIAGYTQNESGAPVPCYWRNETRYDLQIVENESGFAEDIYVVGIDVYVSGYTVDNTGYSTPCYWINGNRVELSRFPLSNDAFALAIKVKDNTVYTAGFGDITDPGITETEFFPFYWINTSPDILEVLPPVPAVPEAPQGSAYAIDITENAVYISGYSRDSNGVNVPCYWENNVRTDLPVLDLSQDGKAYGIYIAED